MALVPAKDLKKAPSVESLLDDLNSAIILANETGQKSTRSYGPNAIYGKYGCENDPTVLKVLYKLREAGYSAMIKYDFRQFADIYLYISWE